MLISLLGPKNINNVHNNQTKEHRTKLGIFSHKIENQVLESFIVKMTRPKHRVDTYTELELAVVNTAETYVFMYPLFFRRPDQLQVPRAVKASRHPMRCMHLVTCRACAQKSGYTSYNSVYVSTL